MRNKVKIDVRRNYERGTAKEMRDALSAALKRRGEVPWKFGTGKKKKP
jgi:hypothetical protein